METYIYYTILNNLENILFSMNNLIAITTISLLLVFSVADDKCSNDMTLTSRSLERLRLHFLYRDFNKFRSEMNILRKISLQLQGSCGSAIKIPTNRYSCPTAYSMLSEFLEDEGFALLYDTDYLIELSLVIKEFIPLVSSLLAQNCENEWKEKFIHRQEPAQYDFDNDEEFKHIHIDYEGEEDDINQSVESIPKNESLPNITYKLNNLEPKIEVEEEDYSCMPFPTTEPTF